MSIWPRKIFDWKVGILRSSQDNTNASNRSTRMSKLSFVPEALKKIKKNPSALYLLPAALFVLTTTILFLAAPVIAQRVQVSPASPRLGDTISVVIQEATKQGTKPTVTMDSKSYPMFPINTNTYRAFLPTTPLDRPGIRQIQVQVDGQVENLAVNVQNRTFPTQRIRIATTSSGGLKPTQHELDRVAAFRQLVTPEKYWNGRFIPPSRARRSTGYGVRRYYNGVFAKDYYHRGLDFAGPQGSPVVAPAPGRVALVGKLSEGFRLHGNTIGIDHGQGVTSVFLHLSRINVQEGDFVQAGQVIGAIGSTGASTGPHLHWGLYVNGKSIDPAPWLAQTME